MKNAANNNFEEYFDNGGSVMPFANMAHAVKPNSPMCIDLELPIWMVEALNQEAQRQGISLQSLCKIYLDDLITEKAKRISA